MHQTEDAGATATGWIRTIAPAAPSLADMCSSNACRYPLNPGMAQVWRMVSIPGTS